MIRRQTNPARSSAPLPSLRAALRATARRLLGDRRAMSSMEFAVIIGPTLGLLLVALQIPMIFFAQQALQGAAMMAGRQIMTGTAQTTNMSQSQFQQAVCANLSSIFPCSSLMVDVESAGSFGSIGTGTPTLNYSNGSVANNWAYSPGGPSDVVIVRVMYNWPVFAAALIPNLANQPNNKRLLVGTSVFKNEPYP